MNLVVSRVDGYLGMGELCCWCLIAPCDGKWFKLVTNIMLCVAFTVQLLSHIDQRHKTFDLWAVNLNIHIGRRTRIESHCHFCHNAKISS